ncbi:MAG: hypothetical protein AAFY42_02915 [Pseudomonadota bacterium]
MATLQNWLARLENSGLRKDFPLLTLGSGYAFRWNVPVHPEFGDFSSGVFEMVARATPGETDPVLATFTVQAGAAANGIVPISVSLNVNDQSAIAAAGVPEYVKDLCAAVYYTPSGGGRDICRAGLLPIAEGV